MRSILDFLRNKDNSLMEAGWQWWIATCHKIGKRVLPWEIVQVIWMTISVVWAKIWKTHNSISRSISLNPLSSSPDFELHFGHKLFHIRLYYLMIIFHFFFCPASSLNPYFLVYMIRRSRFGARYQFSDASHSFMPYRDSVLPRPSVIRTSWVWWRWCWWIQLG